MGHRFPIYVGDRVALAPHTDDWMAGRRFGVVMKTEALPALFGAKRYFVTFGKGGRWFYAEDMLGAVNTMPGQGRMPGLIGPSASAMRSTEPLIDADEPDCEMFRADGSCIHSEHMMQAGL